MLGGVRNIGSETWYSDPHFSTNDPTGVPSSDERNHHDEHDKLADDDEKEEEEEEGDGDGDDDDNEIVAKEFGSLIRMSRQGILLLFRLERRGVVTRRSITTKTTTRTQTTKTSTRTQEVITNMQSITTMRNTTRLTKKSYTATRNPPMTMTTATMMSSPLTMDIAGANITDSITMKRKEIVMRLRALKKQRQPPMRMM